jgi:hypothetical protein
MKAFVKENTHLSREYNDFGWGNGYVAIPEGHPCHGLGYDEIHARYDIDVHYGLTYASSAGTNSYLEANVEGINPTDWIVGFDTAHLGDGLDRWPNEASVMHEANHLKDQLEAIKP